MAAVVAQRIDGYSAGGYATGQTFAFPGSTVAGNAIVIILVHSYLACPPSVTDSQGNTYTSKGAQPSPVASNFLWVFTAVAGSSAACTMTITFSCGNVKQFFASEVAGLVADPYDVQNVASDSADPYGAGSITTTTDGAYIMACWHRNGSGVNGTAVNSPLAFVTDGVNNATADGVQTSAGAFTPELSAPTGTIYGFTAAFKAAGGAAGQPTGRRFGLVPHTALTRVREVGRTGVTIMQIPHTKAA